MQIKFFVLGCILMLCNLIIGQKNLSVHQPEMMYFYWQYENIVKWNMCIECDSIEINSIGCKFEKVSPNSGIVRVDRGTITTRLRYKCYYNGQNIWIDSIQVNAGPIPKPNVHLKLGESTPLFKVEIDQKYNLSTSQIENWSGLEITKNRAVPLDLHYEVGKWLVEVKGEHFFEHGNSLSIELIEKLRQVTVGDTIRFWSIEATIPEQEYEEYMEFKAEIIVH